MIKMKKKFTWLGFVNRYFLQFFFVRLTKHIGTIENENSYYSIQYFVLPFTGYGNDYIYLNNYPKFLKLTKTK